MPLELGPVATPQAAGVLAQPLAQQRRAVAGDPENERCDQVAMAAASRSDLQPDSGYEGLEGSALRGHNPILHRKDDR